jgi:hypothetical protein
MVDPSVNGFHDESVPPQLPNLHRPTKALT